MIRIVHVLIYFLLCLGLGLLFARVRWLETASNLMRRSRQGMDEAARRRLLENRRQLLTLQKNHSLWYRLEQELNYSGLKRRFGFLTAELWVVFNIICIAILSVLLLTLWGWWQMLLGVFCFWGVEVIFFFLRKARAFRSVNANLIKFLDFLGNYSITAGELTGIFTQISKYVEDPLKTVLEECSYEAQTTGDSGLALLSMAEKIEHPKFKELVRNMEISVRYCADFSLLVKNSRRMMREYLRLSEERRSLLREAVINMAMLLGMSGFALVVVDGLLETSIWMILFETLPGQIAMGGVVFIMLLFAGKLMERR